MLTPWPYDPISSIQLLAIQGVDIERSEIFLFSALDSDDFYVLAPSGSSFACHLEGINASLLKGENESYLISANGRYCHISLGIYLGCSSEAGGELIRYSSGFCLISNNTVLCHFEGYGFSSEPKLVGGCVQYKNDLFGDEVKLKLCDLKEVSWRDLNETRPG